MYTYLYIYISICIYICMFVARLRTLCRLPGCRRLLLFWLRQAPEEVPLKDNAWRSKARRACISKNSRVRARRSEPVCNSRRAAGLRSQCQAALLLEEDGRERRVNLSQCRRIRKTCATCLSLACAHCADCPWLCRRLLLFLAAASTQGGTSERRRLAR